MRRGDRQQPGVCRSPATAVIAASQAARQQSADSPPSHTHTTTTIASVCKHVCHSCTPLYSPLSSGAPDNTYGCAHTPPTLTHSLMPSSPPPKKTHTPPPPPFDRWLSGIYPVIHPLSKALGNTRLRLKVLLDLQPQEQPTDAWLASHPAAHWQVSGPLAALADLQTAAAAAEPSADAARDDAAAGGGQVVVGGGPAEEEQQQQQQGQQGGSSSAAATQVAVASNGDDGPAPAETVSRQQQQEQQQQEQQQQQGLVVEAGVSSAPAATAAAGAGSAQLGGSSRAGGLRLRAEVSRVSAPPGVLSPGSAAAGDGAAAHSVCASPGPAQQQQQQQLMLLPAVQGSPIQQQQQQVAQQALVVAGGRHVALCDVRVCVECALNLDLPELGPGAAHRSCSPVAVAVAPQSCSHLKGWMVGCNKCFAADRSTPASGLG